MAREPVTYDTDLHKLGYTASTTGLWVPLAGTFEPDASGGGGGGGGTGGGGGGGTDPGTTVDYTTAAGKLGWGTPLASDEFDYGTSASPVVPDPARWSVYDSAGHAGNGLRRPSQMRVDGTKLTITGAAGSALTGGMAHKENRQYGRWEIRSRSYYTADPTRPGDQNGGYHPVAIIWPTNDAWPGNGEYDYMENGEPGEQAAGAFLHYPSLDGSDHQIEVTPYPIDMRQFHNYAIEWSSTGIKLYVDGNLWYAASGGAASDRKALQAMTEGQLTLQLDAFQATGCIASTMEVEWVRVYSLTPTGGGGGSGSSLIGAPLNLAISVDTSAGSPRAVCTWQPPGFGTAAAYQVHELRKYPTDTLKATVSTTSRTSGGLNPGTLEYAIKAVDAAGNVSAFSNTVVVVVTASGATVSPGQPAGWDGSSGTGGSTTPTDGTDPGADPGGDGTGATTGAVPWSRTFRDGTKYNPPTGGDGLAQTTIASTSGLSSIASNSNVLYTGPALTSAVTISGKSNFTLKGVTLAAGGKLTVTGCSNYILDSVDLQYEPASDAQAGDLVVLRGTGSRAMVRNSMFGPATYTDHSTAVTATTTTQFLAVLDAMDHVYLDKVTFRNKSVPGNAFRIYGDTSSATGGCQYSVVSQVLWTNCNPYKENDQEMARFGTSQMMQTDGYHIVEFCRAENIQTEPEVWSFKMNKSTIRGSTVVDCAGNPCFRHGNDGEFYDNYMVGDKTLTNSTGGAVASGGFRGYGRGHKVHHNTIRVNGTANYQRPILLDGGDTSPDALSSGHANVVGWDVGNNLLVKCGAPIVIGHNYATAPSGCTVHDNWVVECANAGTNGVMVVTGGSGAGVTTTGNTVYATAAAAGLTQGSSGEWKAPAGADRGARTPFVTSAMAGKGATWDPWNGLASSGGGTTPAPVVTSNAVYPMDLMPDYWKLTLAIPSPSDSSKPMEIVKDGTPDLDTYVHTDWFRLNTAKDGIEMRTPYDGVTTANSPNVRTEFREMTSNGKSVAAWPMTSGRHILDVYTQVDQLQGNHCVIAQIHGKSDDVTVFRLEGGTLWITDGDTNHGYQVLTGYTLGTAIALKFDVAGSKCRYYVNDQKVPFELNVSDSASYFKAGNYLQRKGSSGSVTGVTLRRALVTHS